MDSLSTRGKHTRRRFLRRTVYTGAGLWVFGEAVRAAPQMSSRPRRISPNEKMGVAGIGAGGQGYWDIVGASRGTDIVAISDVDFGMGYMAYKKFPKAKQYKDFRKMLEEMDKHIDAVTVSTPDHQHAVATMKAIKMGKHVRTQKPLAHHQALKMNPHFTEGPSALVCPGPLAYSRAPDS